MNIAKTHGQTKQSRNEINIHNGKSASRRSSFMAWIFHTRDYCLVHKMSIWIKFHETLMERQDSPSQDTHSWSHSFVQRHFQTPSLPNIRKVVFPPGSPLCIWFLFSSFSCSCINMTPHTHKNPSYVHPNKEDLDLICMASLTKFNYAKQHINQ